MHFAKTALMSIAALSTFANAAPKEANLHGVLAPEFKGKGGAVARAAPEVPDALVERSAEAGLEKRIIHVTVILVKIIAGNLMAGAARAGIDYAKAKMDNVPEDFKDFDAARRAFTPALVKGMWDNKKDNGVVGIACFNGPYAFGGNGKHEGPADINFKWDMYHTDYDCFELWRGAQVYNKGDGGYENIAYYGQCKFDHGNYLC